MTDIHDRDAATLPPTTRRSALRIGGLCAIVGSAVFAGFRLNHGDLPAADAQAALHFITEHGFYAGVHIGAILGSLISVAGLVVLTSTLTRPTGRLLGRVGAASMLVGLALFSLEHSIDGVAGQSMAGAWAAAAPDGKAVLVQAAYTAFQMLRAPSLLGTLLLWGLAPMLIGRALVVDGYPAWLGWTALGLGVTTVGGSIGLLFREDLFPGFLVYGVLASLLVPLWTIAVGVVMWRRAGSALDGAS